MNTSAMVASSIRELARACVFDHPSIGRRRQECPGVSVIRDAERLRAGSTRTIGRPRWTYTYTLDLTALNRTAQRGEGTPTDDRQEARYGPADR